MATLSTRGSWPLWVRCLALPRLLFQQTNLMLAWYQLEQHASSLTSQHASYITLDGGAPVMAGRPDMDSSNPIYADMRGAAIGRPRSIQVGAPLSSHTLLHMHVVARRAGQSTVHCVAAFQQPWCGNMPRCWATGWSHARWTRSWQPWRRRVCPQVHAIIKLPGQSESASAASRKRASCWCAGPILSTGDIMREEQYHARGMFHEVSGCVSELCRSPSCPCCFISKLTCSHAPMYEEQGVSSTNCEAFTRP